MKNHGPYFLEALNSEGFVLHSHHDKFYGHFSNLRSAKRAAKQMLRDSELLAADMKKVSIIDQDTKCVAVFVVWRVVL